MHSDEKQSKGRDVINFNVAPGQSAVMSPPSAILSSVIANLLSIPDLWPVQKDSWHAS